MKYNRSYFEELEQIYKQFPSKIHENKPETAYHFERSIASIQSEIRWVKKQKDFSNKQRSTMIRELEEQLRENKLLLERFK